MSRDYTIDDFTLDKIEFEFGDDTDLCDTEDMLNQALTNVNFLRQKYKETKDYRYFRAMRQLMPMGYNYRITWSSNYAGLRNIYFQRKNHLLTEWREDFCNWINTLPYGEALITYKG